MGNSSREMARPRNSEARSADSILEDEPVTYTVAGSVSTTRRRNAPHSGTSCISSKNRNAPSRRARGFMA